MTQFELSDKAEVSARSFMEEQMAKNPSTPTTIGGRFSYVFTPTSVGHIVSIKDNQTGDERNLTDYSSW